MSAALEIGEVDWIMTTAYYARYFALYALLMKLGVKCEIHDCTLSVGRLLAEEGVLEAGLVEDLALAKQSRIDSQYYVVAELSSKAVNLNVEGARKFVLEVKKDIENLSDEQITKIRSQLAFLKGS